MSRVEENLSTLGESLPVASKPVANYLGCKRSGNTLYVSGRVSQIRGEVGTDLSVAEAQIAAKGALLDILAIIKDEIGNLDVCPARTTGVGVAPCSSGGDMTCCGVGSLVPVIGIPSFSRTQRMIRSRSVSEKPSKVATISLTASRSSFGSAKSHSKCGDHLS